jgi:cbb3-type cytochrome c oxidase subunit III
MNKNKYLLLLSSIGTLLLLMAAAAHEHLLKDWRRIQSSARSDEGAVPVQLRQIVNPALRVSDRCVSCHVAMAPGEQSVRGAAVLKTHKPVVHDPIEYGCSVCHAGQGLATEKDDAHGDVHFWPEPMIPARFSYAGCGTCHAPLGIPNRDLYARARLAFERLDCLACHRVDGRGATIRPGGGGMEGPDLSRTGIKGYDTGWYEKHVALSKKETKGPWVTSFAAVSEADRQLLSVYLSTRVAAPGLVEAKALFHSTGCLGCHKVSGAGGDEGPDLTRAGQKDPGQLGFAHVPGERTLENWFAEHFRSPVGVVADSQMPSPGVSDRDIDQLTMYVLSLRRRDLPGAYMPKDRMRAARFQEREFSSDGATIYGAFCSGCHGLDGMGRRAPGMAALPSIANPDFLTLVSDEFLEETVKRGRPGRRMPGWGEKDGGLLPDEIKAVVAHVRAMGGVESRPTQTPARWVTGNAARGKALFESSCGGCHGARGEGADGPALANPVLLASATDTFLVETIRRGRRGTAMEGFETPSVVRRTLAKEDIESVVAFIRTWEGGKK